jgi:hypothetical protein
VTEAEWMACTDPTPMLEFLRGNASERKFRLLAVACCRRVWNLLDEESRNKVELAERFADGLAAKEEMPAPWPLCGLREDPSSPEDWGMLRAFGSARDAAKMAAALATDRTGLDHPARQAAFYASGAVAWEAAGAARQAAEAEAWAKRWGTVEAGEHKHQVSLLRDLIGNPFRPIIVDPVWRTPKVMDLAQTIYDERAFDRLPVLADALEEAGCQDQDILGHCRSGGEHVRGCWVLDLVLGKS